jgi:tRNA(fMet)-specific endonuclease VapC
MPKEWPMVVLLDTDLFSMLQYADRSAAPLQRRLEKLPLTGIHVSIISFQEQTRGWLAYIHRARKREHVLRGFFFLQELLRHYHVHPVMGFDEAAMDEFLNLQSQRIRIGTNDLRIAAIAKAHGAKLLSRNLRDFRQVPGLDVEDWTA